MTMRFVLDDLIATIYFQYLYQVTEKPSIRALRSSYEK